MRRRGLLARALAASALTCSLASAEPDDDVFREGTRALERGAHDEAIDHFEWLADRSFSHPDASFNRAAAYLMRAESSQPMAGDLGRAAAALTETKLLRPGDHEAARALDLVLEEIARRRASRGAEPVDVEPSLGWAVVGLLPEDTWAAIAGASSLFLTIGLAFRFWIRRPGWRIAGALFSIAGAILLVGAGALSAFARQERLRRHPAVVVVAEARILDERGVARSGGDQIVPEGAAVRVTEQRGALARVVWGSTHGWLARSQLRVLARP